MSKYQSKSLKTYKLEVVNHILDNVHGFIGLSKVENEIEQLPIFKRLQNISQLGLANRIFPCALHNRYIHSLGVMHISDQMAIHLKNSGAEISDDDRQLLRLAGMLHDVGHYPYSHDVESAYKELDKNTPIQINDLWSLRCNALIKVENTRICNKNIRKLSMEADNNKYHHENIGAEVIKNSTAIKKAINNYFVIGNSKYKRDKKAGIDEDYITEAIISDICAIIKGNAYHDSLYFKDNFKVLVQLMHSELDADRIDYLLRDSTFSGASYGSFDLGMLLQNLKIGIYQSEKIVGVTLKGIGCAEQFLINRYLAYNQIINHKYTSIIGCMLQCVMGWFLTERRSKFPYPDIMNLITKHENNRQSFYDFTDSYILNLINEIGNDKDAHDCPDDIFRFIKQLKSFRALRVKNESIFSGVYNEAIQDNITKSETYINLISIDEEDIKTVFQYREIHLTEHVPLKCFEMALKRAESEQKIDPELHDLFLIDRLQHGLAIIEDGKEPYLIVDSNRSMIHDVYNLKYCILREYAID